MFSSSITGPQVVLRVVEPHQFHKNKVLSEHKILMDNILVAFMKKPSEGMFTIGSVFSEFSTINTVLVYVIPDSNMIVTIKKVVFSSSL